MTAVESECRIAFCARPARRAGDHLGARARRDRDLGGARERRVRIAGDRDPARADLVGDLERGQRVGRAAARGEGDDGVARREPARAQRGARALGVVFGALARAQQRGRAAGDQPFDALGLEAEGGRDLRRVGAAEAAARAGSGTEPTAAAGKDLGQHVHGARDVVEHLADGFDGAAVLFVDRSEDLARGAAIEIGGARERRLGRRRLGELVRAAGGRHLRIRAFQDVRHRASHP
jgi:hypothetical protein